jgi:hypothetical protein
MTASGCPRCAWHMQLRTLAHRARWRTARRRGQPALAGAAAAACARGGLHAQLLRRHHRRQLHPVHLAGACPNSAPAECQASIGAARQPSTSGAAAARSTSQQRGGRRWPRVRLFTAGACACCGQRHTPARSRACPHTLHGTLQSRLGSKLLHDNRSAEHARRARPRPAAPHPPAWAPPPPAARPRRARAAAGWACATQARARRPPRPPRLAAAPPPPAVRPARPRPPAAPPATRTCAGPPAPRAAGLGAGRVTQGACGRGRARHGAAAWRAHVARDVLVGAMAAQGRREAGGKVNRKIPRRRAAAWPWTARAARTKRWTPRAVKHAAAGTAWQVQAEAGMRLVWRGVRLERGGGQHGAHRARRQRQAARLGLPGALPRARAAQPRPRTALAGRGAP